MLLTCTALAIVGTNAAVVALWPLWLIAHSGRLS